MSSVSELILNSGPFSPVWIAGTMKDKIGKKVVLSTNIADIAEKIMHEERVNLVLRLSGMLLKGLVVVYSKKTQYMLNDCEDIITKIMQSFKTSAVDLAPSGGRSDEALTISISKQAHGTEINYAYGDLNEWIQAQDPEQEYFVRPEPLEFPQSEASQSVPQLSDSSFSSATSQTLINSDAGDMTAFIPPSPVPAFDPPAVPDWTNLPSDDDALPAVDDNFDLPEILNEGESDGENEPEADDKGKGRVVDNKIDLPNVRGQQRRRARPTASRRQAALPQNDELEELFELAKQEFAKPPQPGDLDDMDDDIPGGFGGFSDVETNRNEYNVGINSESEQNEFSDNPDYAATKRVSLPSTPIEYIDLNSRRSAGASGNQTPSAVDMFSPYPNIQFAIEKTPRRLAEDSITQETITTLDKIRHAMGDKNSITFDKAFAGSSRHGAAAAFYQLLVLRSTGYTIDVDQEKPYGPINISQGRSFQSH
ncbi:N terminus of Rad21 [Tritrichomonas foetus]|uniref:N terminus of Rad21 n=1 Tax=Tritrichomonas foetus TaxID=1144522 RepID=A0A1J4K3V1_9EUKA|nr:N terminus of Rad21 [Tritrichomonas foetus]|eukprot:OHT04428.1 N terminus of Rad21 [Tritrichomonas foetus]